MQGCRRSPQDCRRKNEKTRRERVITRTRAILNDAPAFIKRMPMTLLSQEASFVYAKISARDEHFRARLPHGSGNG